MGSFTAAPDGYIEDEEIMHSEGSTTRILIIESDEAMFQVRQCMAQVLEELPPVELFHARDATEALALIESLSPDVIVLDDEEPAERDLFFDSLMTDHPPIVLCTESQQQNSMTMELDREVTYIPKSDTLEGFHQTLQLAASLGLKFTSTRVPQMLH